MESNSKDFTKRDSKAPILPAAELWWNEVTYCSSYLCTVLSQSYYIYSILICFTKLLLKNSSDEIWCWKQERLENDTDTYTYNLWV